MSNTRSRPHVTIGAFPKASFIPRETTVDQPWMGALKNCGDPEMPRQPHRERAGLGGWVPILLPPPELEILLLCTLPNLGNGSRNETAHFMCKEGERVASYPKKMTDMKDRRQPGCLCPRRGQD